MTSVTPAGDACSSLENSSAILRYSKDLADAETVICRERLADILNRHWFLGSVSAPL